VKLRRVAGLAAALALGLVPSARPGPEGLPLHVCPPCQFDCHHLRFPGPGVCPVCGMTLIEATDDEGRAIVLIEAYPRATVVDTVHARELRADLGVTYRNVRIPAGEVELEARLYVPPAVAIPGPAVVVNHGSAPSTFADVALYSRTCLEAGLVVLAYSKRGCGTSTGTYRPFDVVTSPSIFGELGADAAAAWRWLAARPEVDPDRVGFIGGSQAGWISPLAASRVDAAFVVNVAGPAVSAGVEAVHGRLVGDGNDTFRQVPTAVADSLVRHHDGPIGFDPAPVLAGLEIPVLWIFGTRDDVVPVGPSVDAIRELRAAGRRNHYLELAPGYTHDLIHVDTGEVLDLRSLLVSWLSERGILGTATEASP